MVLVEIAEKTPGGGIMERYPRDGGCWIAEASFVTGWSLPWAFAPWRCQCRAARILSPAHGVGAVPRYTPGLSSRTWAITAAPCCSKSSANAFSRLRL
jgi:hypothetical protein